MSTYINGIGIISVQETFDVTDFLSKPKSHSGNCLTIVEPDYATWIDAKLLRRMSRIIRMGVATSTLALREADVKIPDAIVTGTSFGCLEDTGSFLTKLIQQKEEALNPTPFIQSTHNTIGSQIALLLQCFGYNQTYSQRGFSFEHALLDALLLTAENKTVLAGSADELTNISFAIQQRFDLFKSTLAGEGAAYFLLSPLPSSNSYAQLTDVMTLFKPEGDEINQKLAILFQQHEWQPSSIDVLLIGQNGNPTQDLPYTEFTKQFPKAIISRYKHLCGEYATSTSFALWLAAKMLKEQLIPSIVTEAKHTDNISRILIYNNYQRHYHSFILMEAC